MWYPTTASLHNRSGKIYCKVPSPIGDMHLTSFPFISECENFHVTNRQPWPIGDSTNVIWLVLGTTFVKVENFWEKWYKYLEKWYKFLKKVVQLFGKVIQGFGKVIQCFRKVVQVFEKVVQVLSKVVPLFIEVVQVLGMVVAFLTKLVTIIWFLYCHLWAITWPIGDKSFLQSSVNEKTVDACHLRAMGMKETSTRPRSQIHGLNAGLKGWLDVPASIIYVAYISQSRIRADPGVKFDRLPTMWHEGLIGRGIFTGGVFYQIFFTKTTGEFVDLSSKENV